MEQVKEYILNGLRFTEDQVLLFEKGIPGFEHLKHFVVSTNSDHEPFHWLHSVDDEQVRFVIINPLLFLPDYSPKITKEQLQDLHVEKKEELLLYVIVTLQQRIDLSTANLSGPILINIRRKLGKQLILDDSRYSVKEPIIRR
jgi:flagellar assembly factor FliW